MARIKVINKNLNQDLIGSNFTNTASETIFSLGDFVVETNFTGRRTRDYSNTLSSFAKEITLETLGITSDESRSISTSTSSVKLNFDKSDIRSYVKFGSAYELFRVTYEQIILNYPASLFINTQTNVGGNSTVFDFSYDEFSNTSTFRVPSAIIRNTFGLLFDRGNTATPNNNELKNLNLSFQKYIIWRKDNPQNNSFSVIGFTGDTETDSAIYLKVNGNPFPEIVGNTFKIDYHIKPNPLEYNKFFDGLSQIEKYFISNRKSDFTAFNIFLKKATINDDGNLFYRDTNIAWATIDGYNPVINGALFQSFKNTLLGIGEEYDKIKTDLIARFLTPASLKLYDLTDDGKMTKLLRLYGREFDELRIFVDAIASINKTSYDKRDNIPDVLVKNLAKTFGWDVFDIVTENDITQAFFSSEREFGGNDLLPAEIDIELWRRILINTNYFWKSKGTRHAIKSMFLLIGIPEPFINITEYVYTVEGKINPEEVTLTLEDIPSASFPFDSQGYPIAPVETNDFYFQISGNSDGGQAYIDLYRNLGFRVNRVVDNKKSWTQEGFTERVHYSTPNYFQEDSRLLINTKEIDVTLDLARGIEYDVYCYNRDVDSQFSSTGVTEPYIYINVELNVDDPTTFTLPEVPLSGSQVQMSFNGITLTPQVSGATNYDYTYNTGGTGASVTINSSIFSATTGQDVITVTYLYDRLGSTGYTEVKYFVQAPKVLAAGTILQLDSEPKGDVQLTVNGITMTKGTTLFTGDFIINPSNRTQLLIQNNDLKNYLLTNPVIRIWSIEDGNNLTNAEKRSEVHRVDSFNSTKFYFNSGINRYVYVMNFAAFDQDAIKITVNGITLTNGKDFVLNQSNKKEIFLPPSIQLGSVIGAYYIIDGGISYTDNSISFTAPNVINVPNKNISVLRRGNTINVSGSLNNNGFYTIASATTNQIYVTVDDIVNESAGATITITKTSNNALLPPDPTFPDIGDMSFLEYLELITRRLINVPRRKTITDNNGGYYPTVQKIYEEYLKRSFLSDNDPLKSNGYTFGNLYPFINQYNGFFNRFVNQLLPATIIQRKSGILIRNTIFNRQKFRYPRGVNFNPTLEWLGTDGSEFVRVVDLNAVPTTTIPNVEEELAPPIDDGTESEATITTTQTPTIATLRFVNTTPSSGNEITPTIVNGALGNEDIWEFDIEVVSTFFSPIPYRIRIESPTLPNDVGVDNVIGDAVGGGIFYDGAIIANTTISNGNINTIGGNFVNLNSLGNSGDLRFVLEVDETNTGSFIVQDTLYFEVEQS